MTVAQTPPNKIVFIMCLQIEVGKAWASVNEEQLHEEGGSGHLVMRAVRVAGSRPIGCIVTQQFPPALQQHPPCAERAAAKNGIRMSNVCELH